MLVFDCIARSIISIILLVLLEYYFVVFRDEIEKPSPKIYISIIVLGILCGAVRVFQNRLISLGSIISSVVIICSLGDVIFGYKIGIAVSYIVLGMSVQFVCYLISRAYKK